MRPKLLATVCAALALFGIALAWHSDATAGGVKSDSKVKATATTKTDSSGKQTVTITLDIEKGWCIYANPVGDEEFEGYKTRVTVKAKAKVNTEVTYPTGKVKTVEGKLKFNVYDERTKIEFVVHRAPGDISALQIEILVHATDLKIFCLHPAFIKLTIP